MKYNLKLSWKMTHVLNHVYHIMYITRRCLLLPLLGKVKGCTSQVDLDMTSKTHQGVQPNEIGLKGKLLIPYQRLVQGRDLKASLNMTKLIGKILLMRTLGLSEICKNLI